MKLFDSHCHLDDERFAEDWQQLAADLPGKDVLLAINAGTDLRTSQFGQRLSQQFSNFRFSAGFHPHEAKAMTDEDFMQIKTLCKDENCVAVGEIGLDYHYDFSPREVQREAFERQLALAQELDLPVIIHEREALMDTLDILKKAKNLKGVMHCFSGSRETAKICLDMGLYISFCGTLTFKNAVHPLEVAGFVPHDRALIETDSPYMTPVPFRGERNDPSFVRLVAERLASIWKKSLEETAECTYNNACTLFNIKGK